MLFQTVGHGPSVDCETNLDGSKQHENYTSKPNRKWASLVAQRLKCLPAMRETWVRSLGCKDPLEKGMDTNSSILAWRISWTKEAGRLVHVVAKSPE